jgi:hypothetical protein
MGYRGDSAVDRHEHDHASGLRYSGQRRLGIAYGGEMLKGL